MLTITHGKEELLLDWEMTSHYFLQLQQQLELNKKIYKDHSDNIYVLTKYYLLADREIISQGPVHHNFMLNLITH